jgi:hypothetical protein
VAEDVNTISGTWTADCVSKKDKKKTPDYHIEPRRLGRRAGAQCFLEIQPSRLMTVVSAACNKSQFGRLDKVSLPEDLNFPDLFSETVQKYDKRFAAKCLTYNIEICKT